MLPRDAAADRDAAVRDEFRPVQSRSNNIRVSDNISDNISDRKTVNKILA